MAGVFQVVAVVKAGVQLPHAFSGEHILSKDMFVAWPMDQAKMPNKQVINILLSWRLKISPFSTICFRHGKIPTKVYE